MNSWDDIRMDGMREHRRKPILARDSLHQYESAWQRYDNEQRDLARADAYMGYGLKVQR